MTSLISLAKKKKKKSRHKAMLSDNTKPQMTYNAQMSFPQTKVNSNLTNLDNLDHMTNSLVSLDTLFIVNCK